MSDQGQSGTKPEGGATINPMDADSKVIDGAQEQGAGELNGAELIANERKRQVEEEGWAPEHDDYHDGGLMAVAGACYAMDAIEQIDWTDPDSPETPQDWPWDTCWWKPTTGDPIRQLVKAGAMMAAEIDRMQRKGN